MELGGRVWYVFINKYQLYEKIGKKIAKNLKLNKLHLS